MDSIDFQSDSDSFNPTLWEEQRQQRMTVAFEFEDKKEDDESAGKVKVNFWPLFLCYCFYLSTVTSQIEEGYTEWPLWKVTVIPVFMNTPNVEGQLLGNIGVIQNDVNVLVLTEQVRFTLPPTHTLRYHNMREIQAESGRKITYVLVQR